MTEEQTSAAPPPGPAAGSGARNGLGSRRILIPAAIIFAGAFYYGLSYLATTLTHESTDDAFIAGHIVSVAPRIAGQVAAVHVTDNQSVRANDLLVELDPADYSMALAQKSSAAHSQSQSYNTAMEVYRLMQAKVATAQATVRKAQADLDASAASASLAATNFARSESLLKNRTISPQEFDAAQAANNSAQAALASARENLAEQNSRVAEAQATLKATEAEMGMALAMWNESQTNVAASRLNLSYTKILAPANGRVTRKQVEPGDYLAAGQQIMSIVTSEVWVQANFKESQLEKMKPGQKAVVGIDALGGREFAAHVDSIQAGSGAQFSLLPPENATGNFVKVIQRVPVKLIFDEPLPADFVLGPGLSVVPTVRVSDWTFPAWGTALIALALAGLATFGLVRISGRKSNSD